MVLVGAALMMLSMMQIDEACPARVDEAIRDPCSFVHPSGRSKTWRGLCNLMRQVSTMTNEHTINHAATTAVLLSLLMRSFGLATGVGLGVLLMSALFSG